MLSGDAISILYGLVGLFTIFRLVQQRSSFFDRIVTEEDMHLVWLIAFFLCGGCNEVKELSKDGDLMDEWGEEGTGPGQFDGPMGIAAGLVNEIYVADTGNHRIQKFRTSVKG